MRIGFLKASTGLRVAAGAAIALALSTAAQAAVEIDIGTSLNGGAIVNRASALVNPGDSLAVGNINIGNFMVQSIAATYGLAPDLLNSNTIDIKRLSAHSTSGVLDIYVTMSGLTPDMLGANELFSSFSASAGPAGTKLTTYYNANDAVFGHVTQLGTVTYTGGTFATSDNFVPHPGGPFSLTEVFHLPKAATTNATMDIATNPVPEPAAWTMMILGFGAIGGLMRRARRTAVLAA
jgi:hypothetical protein